MEREERYVVIKLSDIEKALELGHITQSNFTTLEHILSKLWYSRAQRGKEDLKTVVVEHDWPEYEEVWKMLENRVDFLLFFCFQKSRVCLIQFRSYFVILLLLLFGFDVSLLVRFAPMSSSKHSSL